MSALLYGFDTSLSHFGYAVAERTPLGLRFLVAGVLVTKPVAWKGLKKDAPTKTEDHQRRFEWLATQLRAVIARHGAPSLIAVEAVAIPFGKTSAVTVSALGRARGLVDGIAAEHGLIAREFAPRTLQRICRPDAGEAFTRAARRAHGEDVPEELAGKAAVIAAVQALYPELVPLFAQLATANVEHAADAVAALHAALTQEHHHAEAHEEV